MRSIYFLISALLLVGCTHVGSQKAPTVVMTTEAFNYFSGEFENTAYFKKHKPKVIAVAPLAKASASAWSIDLDNENPQKIVRRGLYNHLSSLPFRDVELQEIDLRLKNAGLSSPAQINQMLTENPKKLRSILGVDALVTGNITHFDRLYAGIVSQVAVGCEVKMWDLKTGNLLWRAQNTSRALGGGISLNPIGLALNALTSIWNMREGAMLEQTDNLFREIISTIELPADAYIAAKDKPKIDLFQCMNADKIFTRGQKIAFRLVGNKDCNVWVDLSDYKSGIELSPLPPEMRQAVWEQVKQQIEQDYKQKGHELTDDLRQGIEDYLQTRQIYEGFYIVEPEEEKYDLTPRATIVDQGGQKTTGLDLVNTVNLDALPPKAPLNLTASALNEKIELAWQTPDQEKIAGYEVWTSPTPLSGYQQTAKTENISYLLGNQTNFQEVFIKVRAIDIANNTGEFTPNIKAAALPASNLYDLPQADTNLEGSINTKMLLTAAKGPYQIQQDVLILPGGTIYIEPGTTIKFAPDTALRVYGGNLYAYGTIKNPVNFIPLEDNALPGSFIGLDIEDGDMKLQNCKILKAQTALYIKKSSPLIHNCELGYSAQAGIELGDMAGPEISCTYIHHNQGMGGMVLSGQGSNPKIHNNIFEENIPFHVQSYISKELDLRNNFWQSPPASKQSVLGEGVLLQPTLQSKPCIANPK